VSLEIENYKENSSSASTLAEFSVYIAPYRLRFHRLRLIKTKSGKLIIGLPSYGVDQPDGQKKWHPYIEWSQEKGKEFHAKVMEALTPFMK
jgi:hypothetical protein